MDITYFAETYTEYFSASRQFIQEQKRIPLFGMPDSFILSVSVVNGGCVTIEKFWLRLHCVSTFPLVKPIIV